MNPAAPVVSSRKQKKLLCSGRERERGRLSFVSLDVGTDLKRGPLISEAVEDAAAAAQQVVHASVCVVQIGV